MVRIGREWEGTFMLRLAIVDDHGIVRAGFREMLVDELGIRIEFEAASGEEALQKIQQQPCNVLLLDLALPGQSGVDVLRVVRQRHPDLKVLVLSGYQIGRASCRERV